MDSYCRRRARDVACIGLQRGDNELLLELSSRLIQGQTLVDQLIDQLTESSVECLLTGHDQP